MAVRLRHMGDDTRRDGPEGQSDLDRFPTSCFWCG